LIAYVTKYMPICMRACSVSLTQVHQELEDASQMSGASWWYNFSHIVVPLILAGLLVGWVYVLTLTVKSLSLPVLLGHARTEMMPVLNFNLYEAGQYTGFNTLGVVVVVVVTTLSLIARQVEPPLRSGRYPLGAAVIETQNLRKSYVHFPFLGDGLWLCHGLVYRQRYDNLFQ
jgi:ABC-type Fe3+ transport system permease subunit